MLLSKKTSIKVSREYANLIGHMCYAASKLWNVCNLSLIHILVERKNLDLDMLTGMCQKKLTRGGKTLHLSVKCGDVYKRQVVNSEHNK